MSESSREAKHTPWTVHSCGNPEHGPGWECHYVKDSTGARILRSVTREVAERYAAAPDTAEALADLLSAPWVVDEATVPKMGADTRPEQVVGTLSVGLLRMRKARAAMQKTGVLP